MTILGIGTDIIEVERIQEAIKKHGQRFIERLFTEKERIYCEQYQKKEARFAGRFAAKEAVLKALGTGVGEFGWHDVEIINDAKGKPEVHCSLALQKHFCIGHILISISHCNSYATATAIIIGQQDS